MRRERTRANALAVSTYWADNSRYDSSIIGLVEKYVGYDEGGWVHRSNAPDRSVVCDLKGLFTLMVPHD